MGTGYIKKISGPVVCAENSQELAMREMVHVGNEGLIGEVISIEEKQAIIQVYEHTQGLRVGEKIEGTGSPMSVTLGPGLMSNIFDGIARPLSEMAAISGSFISRGLKVDTIDTDRKWSIKMLSSMGDKAEGGKIFGNTCDITAGVAYQNV